MDITAGEINIPASTTIRQGIIHISDQEAWDPVLHTLIAAGDDVALDSITFYGDNDPWDGNYQQNQNMVIQSPSSPRYTGLVINNCTFRNLFGFPMAGTGDGAIIENSLFIECSNGLNLNGNGVTYRQLTLVDAESIEFSGNNSLVEYCTITRGYVGISAGGRQSGDATTGQIVRYNTVSGARDGSGIGIILADLNDGPLVHDNTVDDCDIGLASVPAAGLPVTNAIMRDNTVTNCDIGVYLSGDTQSITIQDSEISGCTQGVQVNCDNAILDSLNLHDNGTDIVLTANAQNITIRNCTYSTLTADPAATYTIE